MFSNHVPPYVDVLEDWKMGNSGFTHNVAVLIENRQLDAWNLDRQ
jgi:hypothetical protein